MALEALPNNSNELFNFVMIYDTISATPINNNNTYQISSPTTTTTTTTNSTTNNWLPPPPPPSQGIISTNTSSLLVTRNCEKAIEEEDDDDDDGDGDNKELGQGQGHNNGDRMMMMMMRTRARRRFQEQEQEQEQERRNNNLGGVVRKKRKRKPRVCKNKEEAETQRMTHIAVERNRRKQMNEHLAVLRSLMPDSYVQRGDQASIVGGAIEFVKELEHLLQSLEAQKLQAMNTNSNNNNNNNNSGEEPMVDNANANANDKDNDNDDHDHDDKDDEMVAHHHHHHQRAAPFAQFFVYPQYTWSQISNKYTSKTKAAIADIEVTLIETHASLRIFTRRSPRQLSNLIAGFQSLHLTVLHLNLTTLNPFVLYSLSLKVEEGCLLSSVDDIAAAVHHMLTIIIEEETTMPMCC
ncbi:hypothetical protein CsatA_011233 [Cannabis sativa]